MQAKNVTDNVFPLPMTTHLAFIFLIKILMSVKRKHTNATSTLCASTRKDPMFANVLKDTTPWE